MFTNRLGLVNTCTSVAGISDPDTVAAVIDVAAKVYRPVQRTVQSWHKGDVGRLKAAVGKSMADFTRSFNITTPIQTLWNDFSSRVEGIVNKHVPTAVTSPRYNRPWINRQCKRLSRRKQRRYTRYKLSQKSSDWQKYQVAVKACKQECRRAHNKFVYNLANDDSQQKFWRYVKSRRQDNTGVAPLIRGGTTHDENMVKAEILNDQFSSVFTPPSGFQHQVDRSKHPTVSSINVDTNGVEKLLLKLSPKKASGPDGMHPFFLKNAASELAPALACIYNASLKQGAVPAEWKLANVAPIYKQKGSRSEAANYRPISLTSIVCKTLEHIIHSHVITHLDKQGLLTDFQHGFRKRRSCESQLAVTIHDLAQGLEKRGQVDVILLDFSKAFDKVNHAKLLHKDDFYGVRGDTLKWIKDWLSGRTQQVVVQNSTSKPAAVTSGVPQGSVLGPLLFLIYINDLPDHVSSSTPRMFADDCAFSRKIDSPADTALLQDDLNKLQEWERKWDMEFNASKCKLLRITRRTSQAVLTNYTIHGEALESVAKEKYLGVVFNTKLNWNDHISTVVGKARGTLGFLQRNFSAAPKRTKQMLYTSKVRSVLGCASTVWAPHTAENKKKLEAVQKKAARFVNNNYNWQADSDAMVQQLQWLTLERRRTHARLALLYRFAHGLAFLPPGILTLMQREGPRPKFFRPGGGAPFCTTFVPATIPVWNRLPTSVVEAPSLDAFKQRFAKMAQPCPLI